MTTIAFGFSTQIVPKLRVDDYVIIDCTSLISFSQDIEKLKEKLTDLEITTIIAVGEYSGVDRDLLRNEKTCRNKFRNSPINPLGKDSYILKTFDTPNLKITNGIGNSWCNLSCYQLSEHIDTHKLSIDLAFIHVPITFPDKLAISEINLIADKLFT